MYVCMHALFLYNITSLQIIVYTDKVYGNNSLTEQASIEIPFSALCDDDTESKNILCYS